MFIFNMKKSVLVVSFLYFMTVAMAQSPGTESAIDKNMPACVNETECDMLSTTDAYIRSTDVVIINNSTTTEKHPNVSKMTNDTKDIAVTVSPPQHTTSSPNSTNSAINVTDIAGGLAKNLVSRKTHGDVCECDLTVSSCDINCCCDSDCKDSDITVFSTCTDHHAKVYDSRYCYDSNFIDYNNTRYLIERLSSNLFCIVHDNLPPAYSASYVPEIPNLKVLNEVISGIDRSRFKRKWDTVHVPHQFNSTEPYRDGDVIWKLQAYFIKPLEVPQSGFTGLCSFKKSVKYLRNWKESCMQTDLSNSNPQLFATTFNNFTVISLPHLYNKTHFASENQNCPKNVCLPIETHYCRDSWVFCENETTSNGSCSSDACENIVKSVRYVITHNGTGGISSVNVYFRLGNVSDKFYQHFEITHDWASVDQEYVFALSGNPGYITEKPIIVGTLITNKTNDGEYSYVSVNRTNYFLTLPMSQRNGECRNGDRYIIGFGEDLKLQCKVSLATSNFTATSCMELQNKTFAALLENSLSNVTEVNLFKTHVSKFGHVSTDENSDWVQIFLDRIPQNVVTGHLIGDQVRCSGLVTSLRIDIVHSLVPKLETADYHKILGVAITFSDETDMIWPKCLTEDCTDIFTVDVVSYVMFHDASRPSKYYFVEGPNLDINLPHDFFYPFMNGSESIKRSQLVVGFILVAVFIDYYVSANS